jgi:hypothetical protein
MELRSEVTQGDYERIKAKLDLGINRQTEGRAEVAEAIKEMIQSKAYLKKGYKSIAAFAECEYGKSRSWIFKQIRDFATGVVDDKAGSTLCELWKEIDERRKQWESTHNTNEPAPAPNRPEAPVNPPKPAPKSTFCAADFPEKEDKARVTAEAEPETAEVEVDCPKCDGTGKILKTVRTGVTETEAHTLWKAGVPEAEKLTVNYVRYVIGRLAKNDWKLPHDLLFLKNKGEYEERKFKGAP